MNEWMEKEQREREAYALVDKALRSYPLAPAPATLLPAVMARVAVASAEITPPRFSLSWLDVVLSLFLASILTLVCAVWLAIPEQLNAFVQYSGNMLSISWIVIGCLIIVTCLCLMVISIFDRHITIMR